MAKKPVSFVSILLPPATKLRQGNVFTPVRHSLHRGVSVHGVSVRGVSVRGFIVRETPPLHSNEWAECILLECIFVIQVGTYVVYSQVKVIVYVFVLEFLTWSLRFL